MVNRQRMTREHRREQVERCLATGMTVKEWCELNHVSKSTMYYWMERLRKEEPELFGDPTCGEWIVLNCTLRAAPCVALLNLHGTNKAAA